MSTVRFTLTGYANRMRAFSIYTAPIGVRLSVICWEYGQFIAMIVFRCPLYPRNFRNLRVPKPPEGRRFRLQAWQYPSGAIHVGCAL